MAGPARIIIGFAGSRSVYDLVHPRNFLDLMISLSAYFFNDKAPVLENGGFCFVYQFALAESEVRMMMIMLCELLHCLLECSLLIHLVVLVRILL